MAYLCPYCGQILVYANHQVGQNLTCPGCGKPLKLPADGLTFEAYQALSSALPERVVDLTTPKPPEPPAP